MANPESLDMLICFTGKEDTKKKKCSSTGTKGTLSSGSSTISAKSMNLILESLKSKCQRKSTSKNYLGIWRRFNQFVIRLDRKPTLWEDRVSLFLAYLIDNGIQSGSIKCYKSAIKKILVNDGYQWDDNRILLSTLTRACKLENDKVKTRLPIQFGLLELLLFEIQRLFDKQQYLEILYKALFSIGYYGLMRAGELCTTQDANHTVKAKNVHSALNKERLLFVLFSSKTHGAESNPQKIKITSYNDQDVQLNKLKNRNFCPFEAVNNYIAIRGGYKSQNEPFFIFKDGTPVTTTAARTTLRLLIDKLGLNSSLYDLHSFRIGRATDLVTKYNFSINKVKQLGRWKSNAVFKYIR